MSVSCGTGTAAVESEGAACRLEAVFLCGLHTFVHLWALAHVEPFWSHPTHATKDYPSSMVWLSTTTCTPSLPRRRLRPPLLRNMRFSLR